MHKQHRSVRLVLITPVVFAFAGCGDDGAASGADEPTFTQPGGFSTGGLPSTGAGSPSTRPGATGGRSTDNAADGGADVGTAGIAESGDASGGSGGSGGGSGGGGGGN